MAKCILQFYNMEGPSYSPEWWFTNFRVSFVDPRNKKVTYYIDSPNQLYNPTLFEENIIYGDDKNQIHAVNIRTGEELWKIEFGGNVYCISTSHDKMLYAGSKDKNLYAIDPKTGVQKWKFEAGTELFYPVKLIDDKLIFSGGKNKCVYAIDSKTGKEIWKFQADGWVMCKPEIRNGVVYFGSHDKNFYAIDANSGKEIWKSTCKDEVNTTPVFSEKLVYVGSNDSIYAIEIDTGEHKWNYKTEELRMSRNFIYIDGMLFYGGQKYLYALDSTSGQELWKKEVWEQHLFVGFMIKIMNGLLYWHQQNNLYAFDYKTGEERFSFDVGHSSYSFFSSFEPLSFDDLMCIISEVKIKNDNAQKEFDFRKEKLNEFIEKNTVLNQQYSFSKDISDYFIIDDENGKIQMEIDTQEILIPEDSENFLSVFFASEVDNSRGVGMGNSFNDDFYSEFFEIFKDANQKVQSDLAGTMAGNFDGHYSFSLEFLSNGIKWVTEYYEEDED